MGTRPLRTALASALVVVVFAVLAACGSSAQGGEGAGAFSGEDVDLVVPYEPGGGYDAYARALARYLEECLGATIVAEENRFQIVNTVGLVSAQIARAEGARFDLNELSWIGRVAAPPNVVVVARDSPIRTFADLVQARRPVRFVAQGPGANDFIAPNLIGAAYGFPFEIVTGFAGAPEARSAIIAGNAEAHVLPVDSQLAAIESGDVRPIVTIDEEPDPLLPDTPTIYAVAAPDERARGIVDSLVALGQTGRALIASPRMPQERVEALREGFGCAVGNSDLRAELEQQQRPLDVLGGPETGQLVAEVLGAPEEFRRLVEASY
jgi:tripartite-type tricarboxylate transporter receptor subunit TctC